MSPVYFQSVLEIQFALHVSNIFIHLLITYHYQVILIPVDYPLQSVTNC